MAQSSLTHPWPDPFTATVIDVLVVAWTALHRVVAAALSGTPWAGH
jgi:hypothetical protein